MENIKQITVNDIYYDMSIDEFMKLAMVDNFFHGRFNDGEFNSIDSISNTMNVNGSNCDGHQYFYQLGVDIKQVLSEYSRSDNYIISGGKNYFYNYKKLFELLYAINSNLKLQNGYFYYDLIMNPNHFETFNNFLNEKRVVIIGPSYMKDIKLFNNFEVLEIPIKNCYLNMDDICEKISELNSTNEKINYCFVAGMMSSIIIHKFYKIDKQNSYYNIGSAWDYFFQSNKYTMITHRGIYTKLVKEFNQHYLNYIV